MRIGILTHFHKSINYGGVLQSYALCKYLNDQGYEAFQILYKHQLIRLNQTTYRLTEYYRKIVSYMGRKINKKRNAAVKRRMEALFADFRNSIPHTPQEYIKSNLMQLNDEFDAFVVGSDQVWNPLWHDSSYMLDFVNSHKVKISYAASMGVNSIDEEIMHIYREYLKDFKGISVRETAAIEALKPISEKEIILSLDPTLLLTVDDWDKVASKRQVEGRYIFLYLLGNDLKTRKLAERIAREKDMTLVMIPDLLGEFRIKDRMIRGERLINVAPCDFISLIKNAEYVITDSFHACVFSILYKKQFFAFNRVGSINMESRIQNLTRIFECPERYCENPNHIKFEELLLIPPVDYSKNFDSYLMLKQKSVEYLKSNLS